MTEQCDCPACNRGLFCKDGERGVFERGEDRCKRCQVVAWMHSSAGPRFKVGRR